MIGQGVAALSQWIDDYPPNVARDATANLALRVGKVQEEAGEAMAALIGTTDQNPRKGMTHDESHLVAELLDVALTALGAVEHVIGNTGESERLLEEHLRASLARVGLKVRNLEEELAEPLAWYIECALHEITRELRPEEDARRRLWVHNNLHHQDAPVAKLVQVVL